MVQGNFCQYCAEDSKLKCKCGARYCSTEHQKILWKYHKVVCGQPNSDISHPPLQRWEVDEYAKYKFFPLNQQEIDTLEPYDHIVKTLGDELGDFKGLPRESIGSIFKKRFTVPGQDSSELFFQHVTRELESFSIRDRKFTLISTRAFIRQARPAPGGVLTPIPGNLQPLYGIVGYLIPIYLSAFTPSFQFNLISELYLFFSLQEIVGFNQFEPGASGKRLKDLKSLIYFSDVPDANLYRILEIVLLRFRRKAYDFTIGQFELDLFRIQDERNRRIALVPETLRRYL